jgi:hypothetical protein
MSNALIDRMFLDPAENPEEAAGRNENVADDLRDEVRDWEVARQQAAVQSSVQSLLARLRSIQGLLPEDITTLNALQKGDLAALLTDVGKVDRALAAALLGLSYEAAGVYKWRALDEHPCRSKGRCEGIAGCAHERGAALLKDLIRRVRARLPKAEVVP